MPLALRRREGADISQQRRCPRHVRRAVSLGRPPRVAPAFSTIRRSMRFLRQSMPRSFSSLMSLRDPACRFSEDCGFPLAQVKGGSRGARTSFVPESPEKPLSMTAPIASGWSESPGGPCAHWKAPPFRRACRQRSLTGSVIQVCLLRVQKCIVGRGHEVSSNVPARTRYKPSLGLPVLKSQQPHTEQTQRIFTRPLSATLSRGCGSSAVRRKPATARAIENALLVKC